MLSTLDERGSGASRTESHWRRAEWLLVIVVLVCHLGRYALWNSPDYRHSGDGFYIFLLARSVAYDGDLDLTNDYAICGDPWHLAVPTAVGRPANPYYIGPATVWAPLLFVLKHVVTLPPGSSSAVVGGCEGRIPFIVGMFGSVFVAGTVYAGMRLGRMLASRAGSLVGGTVVGFGSSLVVFGSLWWNYTHVWAALALTLAILSFAKLLDAPDRVGRYVVCGLAIGWATLMRPHHVSWLLAPGLYTVGAMITRARQRQLPWREAGRGLVALGAFFAVFSIRLASNHAIYGLAWPPVTGAVYLQPFHAHPFLMLFSAQAGLLYQTPLMWLAVIGAPLSLIAKSTRVFAGLVIVSFLLDFWMCASPLDWAGGATVGPRLLTSFTGLFVAWAALTVDHVNAFVRANPRRYAAFAWSGWLLPALLVSWKLVWSSTVMTAPAIYGRAIDSLLDETYAIVGNPSTLPATAIFAARYGVKPSDFDRVARYAIFRHDFLTGRLEYGDTLTFGRLPEEVVVAAGMTVDAHGGHIAAARDARIVFPLAWPFVTRLVVGYEVPQGSAATTLRLRSGTFFRRIPLGRGRVRAPRGNVEIACPRGALDSGINELVFESDGELTVTSLKFVDDTVHDTASPLRLLRQSTVPP